MTLGFRRISTRFGETAFGVNKKGASVVAPRRPFILMQPSRFAERRLQIQLQRLRLVHAAHAAGAWGAAAVSCAGFLRFLDVCHQSFGGEHEARDGSGVLQSETGYLGRVNHAGLDQIAVLARVRVVAEVLVLGLADFAENYGTFVAGIVNDLTERLFEGALHNVDADGIVIMQLELIESRDAAD